jgi:hypothetical protein
MNYEVKLLQSDIVNLNGRCYSKECMKEIEEQLNLKNIPVLDRAVFDPSEGEIIGKVIKAHHEDDILYLTVNLQHQIKQRFINLCLTGKLATVSDKTKNYNTVTEPNIRLLYADNSNPFFKSSNIKKIIKVIDTE